MQKRVPGGGPMPRTPKEDLNALFLRCKKSHSWGILHILVLNKRVRKRFQKKCKIFGTGSRRGATPGRLAAQNRWFLKGFLPEGRLHRTCGRDHLGAWSLLKKSQISSLLFFFLSFFMLLFHWCCLGWQAWGQNGQPFVPCNQNTHRGSLLCSRAVSCSSSSPSSCSCFIDVVLVERHFWKKWAVFCALQSKHS